MNLITLLSLASVVISRPSPERVEAFKSQVKNTLFKYDNKCVTAINNYYSKSLTYPYSTWQDAAWQDLNDLGSV